MQTIKKEMATMKTTLRDNYKFYSQELLNYLFKRPYTKIEFLMEDLKISRVTVANYLNLLAKDQLITKHGKGRHNYYINVKLINALSEVNIEN